MAVQNHNLTVAECCLRRGGQCQTERGDELRGQSQKIVEASVDQSFDLLLARRPTNGQVNHRLALWGDDTANHSLRSPPGRPASRPILTAVGKPTRRR